MSAKSRLRRRRSPDRGLVLDNYAVRDEIQRMDLAEFVASGLLQEANRRFFHPIGLALEVVRLDDGTYCMGGIWDYRDDPDGIYFVDAATGEPGLPEEDVAISEAYDAEVRRRGGARTARLGGIFQPYGNPWPDPTGVPV